MVIMTDNVGPVTHDQSEAIDKCPSLSQCFSSFERGAQCIYNWLVSVSFAMRAS